MVTIGSTRETTSALAVERVDRSDLVAASLKLWRHQIEEAERRARLEGLQRSDIIRRALDIGLGFRDAEGRPIAAEGVS